MNIFMWIGYIISIALYAQGFAAYFMTFFTEFSRPEISKYIAVGIVILFTAINMLGAKSVGDVELYIVIIKVSILILFSICGLFYINPSHLSLNNINDIKGILYGTGVLFIGYEGFGLVTNAAANMVNPQKNLPKALYTSVLIVIAIYIAVSVTVTGNLTTSEINASKDYALAQAAKPFLGEFGFKLIAIAALFSTASAINATLFGGANICYMIARDGELPAIAADKIWRNASDGLLITSILVICFIMFFNLEGIAMMGSGAFLLIYSAVNIGHLRITNQTGANKKIIFISLFLCLGMFAILEVYTFQQSPTAVYTMIVLLLGSFIAERLYSYLQSH